MYFTELMSSKIIFGKNSFFQLPHEINQFSGKVMIVSGSGITSSIGKKAKDLLETHNKTVLLFSEIEPNPSVDTIRKAIDLGKKENIEIIVAIGGGSALDAGKAIAAGVPSKEVIDDLIGLEKVKSILPLIAIPTTSGTGSEVTRYSILVKEGKKVAIVSTKILPALSIIDPELTMNMPANITIDTGLDALSHLLEGYFSNNSSPISDLYALEGLKFFKESFDGAVKNAYKDREGMSYASLMGGLTINTAGSGLAHAIGYPLTVHLGIPHGRANAIVMPYLFKWQKDSVKEKYSIAQNILGFEELYLDLFRLNEKYDIPINLKDKQNALKDESRWEWFAEEVLKNERLMKLAPKKPTKEEIIKIYGLVRGVYENC